MNMPKLSWVVVPIVFFLAGCPSGDGGGTFNEGAVAPPVAYVANRGTNDVSAYTINTATGVLTPVTGSPFPAGTNPSAVAVSPNGRFAFVSNASTNNVSAYSINAATGVLTPVTGSPFSTGGAAPSAVTVSPNGAFAFVANLGSNNVSVFTINAGTGALTAVAGSPFVVGTNPTGVTVSPDGLVAFVTNGVSSGVSTDVSAFTVNPTSGVLTPVPGSPFAAGTNPIAVAVAPGGTFAYVVNRGDNTITVFSIDAATGALTALLGGTGNPFPTGTAPNGIAITPNGSFLYVSNSGTNNVSAYAINSGTGVLTPLLAGTGNPFAADTTPSGITVTPDGKFVYVANNGSGNVSAYGVDASTGALTALLPGVGNPFIAGTLPSGIATPGRP
jgi:6-phosphogluconolactonase